MSQKTSPVRINSEIGRLRTVVLHRPGGELENITPDTMTHLLFDDIPYLEVAQREHDYFAEILRSRGAQVLYLDALTTGALEDPVVRESFMQEMIDESSIDPRSHDPLMDYLGEMPTLSMVRKIMSGVRRDEVPGSSEGFKLSSMSSSEVSPFHMAPMPNLYFTRDPAAAIGDGVTVNRMRYEARRRESLFAKYILEFHPDLRDNNVPTWYDRNNNYSMEGGDELVLSERVAAIGVSQRTSAEAIELTARALFDGSTFERVIAVQIPDSHAFMHLDTVFTMIDHDKFSIHPEILRGKHEMSVYVLDKPEDVEAPIFIQHASDLRSVLMDSLGLEDAKFIECGNGDPIAAAREQWNDGSNTLAIAPGTVVTYDRNYVTNRAMEDAGIEVITVPGAELGRGRGGPRCMSMPIKRDDIVA